MQAPRSAVLPLLVGLSILLVAIVPAGTARSADGDTPSAHAEPGEDEAPSDTRPSTFAEAEQMVVSASRRPRRRSRIPSFTTILEAEDLDETVSTSVADVLRFVPSLQLTQEGGRGGRAALSLRGLDPNHAVVLVDGVRLNDPTNSRGGSFDPTTLALIDIERIEILRGPLSSIYGSDALAGVVNIITRKAGADDPLETSVRARGGRFHTGNVIAQASAGLGGVAGLTIGAGYDTFRDPNSDGGYDGASLKAKLNAELPLDVGFEAFTRIHESSARGFPESSGGSELATLRQMEDRDVREILFGLALDRAFGDLNTSTIRLSRMSRREDLESPGIDPVPPFDPFADVPPSTAGDEYARWDLALTTDWKLPELEAAGIGFDAQLIAGVDFIWEDGESDTYLDFGGGPTRTPFFDDRRTIGIFGELEERIGEHVVVSAGLRFDTTPDEKDRLSPSAGLTIEIPNTTLTFFGSYGEGFKRPSFFALGNPLVGNPNLLVEKSRGWEVGMRGRALDDRLRAQISYFDVQVNDIVVFDTAIFRLRNESRLISRGVELEFDLDATSWLQVRGGVTFNPTDFEGSVQSPENRSRWRGFGQLVARPLDCIELSVRVLAVTSTKASSFHTGPRVVTLAGYERVDLRVAYLSRDWLELFFEIENLTDRTYREAVGFEAPGVAPRLGVTIRR